MRRTHGNNARIQRNGPCSACVSCWLTAAQPHSHTATQPHERQSACGAPERDRQARQTECTTCSSRCSNKRLVETHPAHAILVALHGRQSKRETKHQHERQSACGAPERNQPTPPTECTTCSSRSSNQRLAVRTIRTDSRRHTLSANHPRHMLAWACRNRRVSHLSAFGTRHLFERTRPHDRREGLNRNARATVSTHIFAIVNGSAHIHETRRLQKNHHSRARTSGLIKPHGL